MLNPEQRITLIARNSTKPDIDWNPTRTMRQRMAFLESIEALRLAMGAALEDVGLDVERIIVDRGADAAEFLSLLAATPTVFSGDIILINDEGCGYLSATGRGGDRQLYALSQHDVRFYLEAHDLVSGRVMLPMSA